MPEAGTTLAREEAKFIPATMKCVQHIEHAYECRHCKKDTIQKRLRFFQLEAKLSLHKMATHYLIRNNAPLLHPMS